MIEKVFCRREGRKGREEKRREELGKTPRTCVHVHKEGLAVFFPFCCPARQLEDNKIPTRAVFAMCFCYRRLVFL